MKAHTYVSPTTVILQLEEKEEILKHSLGGKEGSQTTATDGLLEQEPGNGGTNDGTHDICAKQSWGWEYEIWEYD